MPTYEYRCEACKHEFEAFHSMSAKPIALCPKCKRRKVKRLISAGAGLIFKGSGFYLTDYARKSGQAAPKEGAAKSEASSTEAKPEPKSDTTGPVDKAPAKEAARTETPAKGPEQASKSSRKK